MNMRGTEDIYIRESGVCFGPFPPDRLFYMEKSLAFRNLGPGYSTVEFLFADAGKNFFFVEAKSSSPRPQKDSVDFDDFINKVAVKFQDSYQLFWRAHWDGEILRMRAVKYSNSRLPARKSNFCL